VSIEQLRKRFRVDNFLKIRVYRFNIAKIKHFVIFYPIKMLKYIILTYVSCLIFDLLLIEFTLLA